MEITKKPFTMSFAGNPMRYLLTNVPSGGGGLPAKSVIEISFSDIDPTPDHSVSVTFLGDTRTLTLKAVPVDRDDLPVAEHSWTKERWCLRCYAYMLDDVQITGNYDVELADDSASITLTAKVASGDYDWLAADNTITGISIITTGGGSVGGDEEVVEGVLMQVWKNGTLIIGQDYKPLEADGTVRFEVQEYIYAHLVQAPPPRFFQAVPLFNFHIYYDYFMKYRTVFCNRVAGVYDSRTYSDPDNIWCYAIAGGLNREDLVYNNQHGINWFNQAATKKRWMTWAPPSRITDYFEGHSLFFAFQEPSYSHYQLMCTVFDDADNSLSFNVTSLVGVGKWTVVEFMAGYAQLQLQEYLDGNVNRWLLCLVDGDGNVISDIREFVIDDVYHENVRYFRFRNSWGVYDSFRCSGSFETIPAQDREQVSYISEEVETAFNTPGSDTLIKETQTFKGNSGWLSKDFLNYLRDFMLSTDIYEIDDDRLLRCLLTSNRTSLFKDTLYNYSLAFEYQRAYNDFFFQTSE